MVQPHHACNIQSNIHSIIPSSTPVSVVAIEGFYLSGSSVLVGLLNEFTNVFVVGYSEPSFTKTHVQTTHSECWFFNASHFPEMISSFQKGTPEEIDAEIKQFIAATKRAYSKKGVIDIENLPELYGDEFRIISRHFLYNILDMDAPTLEFMKDREFPDIDSNRHVDYSEYENCSFVKKAGNKHYLFYQFKEMPKEHFHNYVSEFLKSFFAILGKNSACVAYDQLCHEWYLSCLNQYMEVPIKQICVYRDPRDKFMDVCMRDTYWVPRSLDAYCLQERHKLENMFAEHDPNRLFVRFEDLVLKYDDTVKQIMLFLGLKPEQHHAPKSVFDPIISVANIGQYKYYHRPEIISGIEERMSEYCYYPEKENLSKESIALLKSSGNWDDSQLVSFYHHQ